MLVRLNACSLATRIQQPLHCLRRYVEAWDTAAARRGAALPLVAPSHSNVRRGGGVVGEGGRVRTNREDREVGVGVGWIKKKNKHAAIGC